MDIFGQFRAADSLFRLVTGDMHRVTSYPFRPMERVAPGESQPMAMCLPEEEGVPSALIEEFLRRLDEDFSLCTHGVCILRHGHRIAEAAWYPYSGNLPQMQFSLSKSVVGMAVGMAIEEGLLSLDEKMRDIFPDKLPPFYMGKPGEVTVRQLLTMSSGVRFNEMGSVSEKDWTRAWLLSDCEFAPGSRFAYNSMNTYMLSSILCRRTGQNLTQYLTPRLYRPLGIRVAQWETCPMGIEKGGWGLYLTPGDMAKLGLLYLRGGQWEGPSGTAQILPREWAKAATSHQIACRMGTRDAWYGYQLWGLSWGSGCQFNGVFGQYVVLLPEQDMVIAVTSGNDELFEDRTLQHIRECFCSDGALSDHPLPSSASGIRSLRQYTQGLHVIPELRREPVPAEKPGFFARLRRPAAEEPTLPDAARYNGRVYEFPKNNACLLPLVISGVHGNFSDGLDALWFQFEKTHALFWFREDGEVHTLKAGYDGEMLAGELCLHGESYPCRTGVQVLHDEDGRIVLKLFLVFPETPCTRYMKFVFHGEDREWLLLRLNERPSVARAAGMFTSLVTGGRTAEELVPPGLQKLPLFDRMRDLLRPKASGKWNRQAVPERTPQQPEEEPSGCDET